jgi:hypothetical protein
MSGHSNKKHNAKKSNDSFYVKLAILIASAIYLSTMAYGYLASDNEITKGNVIGFVVLSSINFLLYRLLDVFYSSYFFLPLVDLLIINLSVEVLVNFHHKFWYLFMLIPGYLIYKGSGYCWEYVKSIGKTDPNTPQEQQQVPKDQKKKIIKVRN